MESMTVKFNAAPGSLQERLNTRDVALWVAESAFASVSPSALADLVRLPWQLVILETSSPEFEAALAAHGPEEEVLIPRRGYPILVGENPADLRLPQRSLPIYKLADPRDAGARTFAAQLRRMNILDTLRRAAPRDLVLLASAVPEDLKALWSDGFRPSVTVVSEVPEAFDEVEAWRRNRAAGGSVALVALQAEGFSRGLVGEYLEGRLGEHLVVSVRDVRAGLRSVDLSPAEDAQYPILARYDLLRAADLRRLGPDDLEADEVHDFFRDAANSWRPYAAGLPWDRHSEAWSELRQILRRLDRRGAEANSIAYIRAESGAGSTTLARMLAWLAAEEGYPTLFAKRAPFEPASLELVGFISRALDHYRRAVPDEGRLYEPPWLLVFDRDHWEGRDAELRSFLRAFEQGGRPVCVLVVTGPLAGLAYLSSDKFKEIQRLTHEVPLSSAAEFGEHINRYLSPHGPVRSVQEWQGFFQASAVHAESGISSFWVALSFWLQRQIDMNETVQSWMYTQFKAHVCDPDLRAALVEVAAMSTERRPLPDSMLPPTRDWPVTQKLEDLRTEVSGLGLTRLRLEGERYWALAHDILGRFLLNAIYFDADMRRDLGFDRAQSAEHMRFLALKRLSSNPALALTSNRAIAEDFAISIFKIDPEHGHGTLVPFWSEALAALDEMPPILWQTSRTVRHHSAISRRRVAKDKALFHLSASDREALLERAVADIRFALESIPRTGQDESDLNLLNSLARAYQDLHEEAAASGALPDRLRQLRELTQDATRRAWQLNPDSPFVVETYANSLLADAKANPSKTAANGIEVLNLIYTEMERDRSTQRRVELSRLAERAVDLLLAQKIQQDNSDNPEINTIILAIRALATGLTSVAGLSLSEYPPENRLAAARVLSDENARGNLQAVRMLYSLKCIDAPLDFEEQLALLESLRSSGYPLGPQLKLELAILLHQRSRYEDAEEVFRQLRPLWKTGEYFVQVPGRLRWLLDPRGNEWLVTARVGLGVESRGFAQVHEMRNLRIPLRAEEFGLRQLPPGAQIRGYVSFGHNGPFLRPPTARRG